MSYKVTAPYVTVRVPDDQGRMVLREFYAGALIPDGADQDDLDRLCRKGLIAEEGTPQAEAAVPAGVPAPTEEQAKQAAAGPPRTSAPKEDWVAYAVSRRPEGQSEQDARAEAEAKPKAELVAAYGGG